MDAAEQLLELEDELKEYDLYHKNEIYRPYPFQLDLHHRHGLETDKVADQTALICANQIGKTTSAAMEIGYHTTGVYPKWWKGRIYKRPVVAVCAGVSNDSTKRIIQKELLGGMLGDPEWGTGAIPKEFLGKPTKKAGVQEAYESVQVKGVNGLSHIWILSYEQGWKKFQGIRFQVGWTDEEPPLDVWSQLLRGTISQTNARILMTMTPEEGVTEVVDSFMNDLKPGQALVTATWDDAKHPDGVTHLTEEKKKLILAQFPAHQREMRSKGIPMMGSGLVFPVKDEDITCEPVPIQSHWAQIIGVDFGVDHPFAAVRLAWDRDADIVYLAHEYRESGKTPPTHAQVIRGWGDWIPVMWPHDGVIRDKGSGIPLADTYRNCGVKMHYEKFSNPPDPGQKEGAGGQGVEIGLTEMLMRMESGRFKVFNTCPGFMEEKRLYHRKDGQLVKKRDDIISATRYAIQMLRFARTQNYQYGGTISYKDEAAIV